VLGKAEFIGLQTGPTSSGLGWLLDVTNVSVTPYTYSEDFSNDSSVLSADSLKIAFRVHIVWRVLPDRVKEFIERYSTLQPTTVLTASSRSPMETLSASRFEHMRATRCKSTRA
jgi:hypothetical protein